MRGKGLPVADCPVRREATKSDLLAPALLDQPDEVARFVDRDLDEASARARCRHARGASAPVRR